MCHGDHENMAVRGASAVYRQGKMASSERREVRFQSITMDCSSTGGFGQIKKNVLTLTERRVKK